MTPRALHLDADRPDHLQRALDCLLAGGIGALPAETVYGLAGRADRPDTVRRIFDAKGRPGHDPLIVHLAHAHQADTWADLDAAPWVRPLIAAAWPGPLTLVLPSRGHAAAAVQGGLPTLALRVPSHPVFHHLLRQLAPLGLAAPSANPFGRLSPTHAGHVLQSLGERIDFVLDAGPCPMGLESTVVGLDDDGEPVVLRFGALDPDALARLTGRPVRAGVRVLERPLAPGQLASHYAPRTPLHLWTDDPATLAAIPPCPGEAWVIPLGPPPQPLAAWPGPVHALAPDGDPALARQALFATLHALDADPAVACIHALLPPDTPGCAALRDRLLRAATPPPAP
jgi:L-threonylcarbamoyladenylate synthase